MRTTCLCALHERSFSFFKSQRFEMWAVLGLAKGDLHPALAGEFVAASAASGLGLCNNLSPTSEAGGPQF